MSFKTILAVVNFESDPKAGLASSVLIARMFDAHLTVLLVGEAEALPFYGYGGKGYTEIWVKEGEERAAALIQAAEDLEDLLTREGISFDVRAHQAIAAREDNLVARHAIYSDLTVLQRTTDGDMGSVEAQAIDGALFDSGRPLLFLPGNRPLESFGKTVLVAWNSRREAAEAVSSALPVLKRADRVVLAVVEPEIGPDDHGEEPGADMAIVLARHGVTVDVMAVSANGRSTPEALRDTAADIDADLIVMGAYGHSRVRQTILGGTTKDMLSRTRVPLFLAH